MAVERGNEAVVRRFYEEACNEWRLDLLDELVDPDVVFRAALGTTVNGREALRRYLEGVRTAFPDWHHRIDDVVATADRVAVRLTYTGTHAARLGEIEPTGARVEFVGAAFFELAGGLIRVGWAVGDTQPFWRALSVDSVVRRRRSRQQGDRIPGDGPAQTEPRGRRADR